MAANLAHGIACTDFPELSTSQLSSLLDDLEQLVEAAALGDHAQCDVLPLCPALLSGLLYGATRRVLNEPERAVPGLVASNAPPSLYAAVYALCVRRICLLAHAPDGVLRQALARCNTPAILAGGSGESEPPSDLPEAEVADGASLDGEEQWAAEPDDDDCEYEPLESLTLGKPPAAAAAPEAISPLMAAELPSWDEAVVRFAGLLLSLSHDGLVALSPTEW
jgi:hypothetical protein